MLITNVEHFPSQGDSVNNKATIKRKKRSGMLFFNEEGLECGGFIYDGTKKENGHSSGLSLTYDQYDGDQVMQLLTTDSKRGDKRILSSLLAFNDRAENETHEGTELIRKELKGIKEIEAFLDPKLFFRINRSESVQRKYIDKIKRYNKNTLSICLNSEQITLKTSQSRTSDFNLWLGI